MKGKKKSKEKKAIEIIQDGKDKTSSTNLMISLSRLISFI